MLQQAKTMSAIDANCKSNSVARNRNAGKRGQIRNPVVENSSLQLQAEEFGVVGKERRIQIALYGGKIDAVIFYAGMVAHDGEAESV